MKTWEKYMIALLMLAGCSDKGHQPVPAETTHALLLEHASLDVLSRAGDENVALPQSTQIGLYAIDQETGTFNAGERRRNVSYQVADEAGTISSFAPAILEEARSYGIYAYAPIRTVGLEEQDDDAILSVAHGEDFLYASPASLSGVSGTNRSVTLRFAHRMAQVQFFLVADPDLIDEYMKGATFEITGFFEKARLSLNSGNLSVLPENGATLGNLPGLLRTDPVCVIPGAGVQTLTITLTTEKKGKQTKTYDFRFEPGTAYRFTIRYNIALDLEIESSVIVWNEINGGDINIGPTV